MILIQKENIKNDLYEKHKDKFGKYPNVIGLYWRDNSLFESKLLDSINSNKPYNEVDFLTKDQKKMYLNNELLT